MQHLFVSRISRIIFNHRPPILLKIDADEWHAKGIGAFLVMYALYHGSMQRVQCQQIEIKQRKRKKKKKTNRGKRSLSKMRRCVISRNIEFILPSALSPSTADVIRVLYYPKSFPWKVSTAFVKTVYKPTHARVSIPHGETNSVS